MRMFQIENPIENNIISKFTSHAYLHTHTMHTQWVALRDCAVLCHTVLWWAALRNESDYAVYSLHSNDKYQSFLSLSLSLQIRSALDTLLWSLNWMQWTEFICANIEIDWVREPTDTERDCSSGKSIDTIFVRSCFWSTARFYDTAVQRPQQANRKYKPKEEKLIGKHERQKTLSIRRFDVG